jgi:signal transduction histidine kinase
MFKILLPYLRRIYQTRPKEYPNADQLSYDSDVPSLVLVPEESPHLHTKPGNLGEALRDWVSRYEPMADRAGVRLRLDQSHLDWPARYEADTLEQIVSSLLTHALLVTQQNGEVYVVSTFEAAGMTLLVSDGGEVPRPDHQPPSTTVLEVLGVELLRIRELVHRLDGSLGVASLPGTGTTLTIWLPIKPDPVEATEHKTNPLPTVGEVLPNSES